MRVIRANIPLNLRDSEGYETVVEALKDYVVPDDIPYTYIKYNLGKHIIRNEDFYPLVISKKYIGQDLTNKKVIIFRNGGIGDLIFFVPALRFLKKKYEGLNITVCCDRRFMKLLDSLDEVDRVINIPLLFTEVLDSDYYINFEGLIENNPEAEIENAYDLHNKKFYVNIPENEKCPVLKVDEKIDTNVKRMLDKDIKEKKKIITIAFSSTVNVRAVPPQFWMNLIHALGYDYKFYIVGTRRQVPGIENMINGLDKRLQEICVNWCKNTVILNDFRYTMALVKNSDVVIAPDSGLLHVAGGFNIPMIGLYGAFHSDLRLKYYKNAIGINAMSSCMYARGDYKGCFFHGDNNCPMAKKYMDVYSPCMKLITPEHVIKSLKELKIIEDDKEKDS